MKKQFKVNSIHDIYNYSYNDGETRASNYYRLSETIEASTVKEAIELYFKNHLYYSFNYEHSDISDGLLYYSVLVDNDNREINADDSIFKLWKNGKAKLYSNNITISIAEINHIDII